MTAAYVPVYNPTDRPVAVDDEGRTVGGYQWGTAHRSSDAAKAAVDAGRLVELDGDLGESPSADARAAVDTAARLNERHDLFAKLDRPALLEVAGEPAGDELVPAVADWPIEQVRNALTVRTNIPTPAKAARRAPSTEE